MNKNLIYSIIVFIIIYLQHGYCLYYLSNTMANKYENNIYLRDNIQEMLPDANLKWISDYIPTIFLVITLFLVIKYNELDKFLYVVSILLLIKNISCTITLFPVPNGFKNHVKCNEKFQLKHILYGKCGDLMFSVHTALFIVFVLFLIRYGLNRIIGIVFIVLYSLIIVAQKEHYSIDVFIAYFMVYFAYTVIVTTKFKKK